MRVTGVFVVLFCGVLAWADAAADAQANEVLKAIHLRDRGRDVVWDVTIDLIDRSGDVRERTSKLFRRTLAGERSEQVTVFLSPANIRHTALFKVESEEGQDYMWLYVPALKITKQIPAAERGDKFVGTDFTMEDVNLGFKYQDYNGEITERKTEDGHPVAIMRMEPKTPELKRELGFDYAIAKVRTDQATIIDQQFFKGGRPIRHNEALDIQTIDGILTPMELRATDLVNDHKTVLKVRSAQYNTGIPSSYFGKEALAREMYR